MIIQIDDTYINLAYVEFAIPNEFSEDIMEVYFHNGSQLLVDREKFELLFRKGEEDD